MAYLWLLAALLSAGSAQADGPRKLLLLLGGSGDPPGENTLFDDTSAIFGQFAKEGGWESTAVFDGSHATSAQKIQQSFGPQTQTFTADHAQAAFAQYDSMLKSGQLKAGDELLILINNHGAPSAKGEATHSLITENGQFSLDNLRPLLAHLSAAGVRTGILDSSCFSGTTQALANAHTCVISQSASNRVGFSTTSFATAFVPGQTLEDAYLAGRYSDRTADFPEISTPAGRKTALFFRPLLDHSYTTNQEPDYEPGKPCDEQGKDKDQLAALMQNLSGILARLPRDPSDTENVSLTYFFPVFKDRVQAYDEALTRHDDAVRKLNAIAGRPGPVPYITDGAGKPLTYGEIEGLLARPEQVAALRKMLSDDLADPGQKEQGEAGLKALEAVEQLADSPEVKAIRGMRQQIWRKDGMSAALYEPARQIADSERAMYAKLYADHKSEEKEEEPCASFTL